MYTLTSEIKKQCKRLQTSYQTKSKNQNIVHYYEILESFQKNCWKSDGTTKFQKPKNFSQEKLKLIFTLRNANFHKPKASLFGNKKLKQVDFQNC